MSDVTPADAFELLHARCAGSLTRQAFLLCGHRALARRAVADAFHRAWEQWPAVAVDPDPVGWLRAATYQYALAPWRHSRLLRSRRYARAVRTTPPRDRALFGALLQLPHAYRAALLLRDGAGLSLARTAAEMEASTRATAERLRNARAALAESVPELRDAPPERLRAVTACLVRELATPQPTPLPPPRIARRRGERRSWYRTAAALGLTGTVAAATAFTLVSSHGGRTVPLPPVPKPPSATLAPAQQPGRLLPMTA